MTSLLTRRCWRPRCRSVVRRSGGASDHRTHHVDGDGQRDHAKEADPGEHGAGRDFVRLARALLTAKVGDVELLLGERPEGNVKNQQQGESSCW